MKKENSQQSEKFTTTVKEINKESSTSEELIKRTPVKETPFTIISIEDKHFGTFGQYKITEDYKSVEECEKELTPITWNRVIQLCSIITDILTKKN